MRVAVIGAGWAGLAAAVEATQRGCHVEVFERAPSVGGRARRVHWQVGHQQVAIDNGQHVMIGAYRETLALMRRVGVDERAVLQRLTLRIEYPGGPTIRAPSWPAPFHLAAAVAGARGLSCRARLSALRFAAWARGRGWRLDEDRTVEALMLELRVDPDATMLLWQPLCLAALNTPIEQASAQVFLNVLRDSVGAARAASDLLVPRTDLSAVLPDAACEWLYRRGARVRMRSSVRKLEWLSRAGGRSRPLWALPGTGAQEPFDAVIVATAPRDAAALLATGVESTTGANPDDLGGAARTISALNTLRPSPIVTAWMLLPDGPHWNRAMWALRTDLPNSPAQWLFARDPQADGRRLLAAVISAHSGLRDDPALGRAVLLQIRRETCGSRTRACEMVPDGAPMKLVTERHATFLCTPSLVRPGNSTGLPTVYLAGDYTESPYPGTLETAVRSGMAAARAIGTSAHGASAR